MSKFKDPFNLSKQSLKRRFNESEINDNTTSNPLLLNIVIEDSTVGNNAENHIEENVHQFPESLIDFEEETLSDFENIESSEADCEMNENFEPSLKQWVIDYGIQQNAVSNLLQILKSNGHPNLPKDCRTFMQTPNKRNVLSINPGYYVHIGLKNGLKKHLINVKELPSEILIDFNIDGVPISKSSTNCFWLILCRIFNLKNPRIFVVGVYNGNQKPENFNEFLNPFVDELIEMIDQSFVIESRVLTLKIRVFILDAPARAAVTGTKGHNAYHGCGKCTVEGDYVSNRVVYIGKGNPRNNLSFRNQSDPDHHNSHSALERLISLDMVKQFPHDYLHVVLLGVVRKLLRLWIAGKPNSLLPNRSVVQISNILENLNKTQPKEFQRRTRKLSHLNYYKGSELRTFLLYTGPFVLKNILPSDKYEHFLLLHASILILCSEDKLSQISVAEKMLEAFVEDFEILYGRENMSFNVHSLLHIVDDVREFGTLDNYSAFGFESFMYKVKRLLKKNNQHLQQISNRIEEKYLFDSFSESEIKFPILKQQKLIRHKQIYLAVETKNFKINNSDRNKWIMSEKFEIIEFEYAEKSNEQILIHGRMIMNTFEFYETPIKSSKFKIYSALPDKSNLRTWDLKSIKYKLFKMHNDENSSLVFFPLFHTHNGAM